MTDRRFLPCHLARPAPTPGRDGGPALAGAALALGCHAVVSARQRRSVRVKALPSPSGPGDRTVRSPPWAGRSGGRSAARGRCPGRRAGPRQKRSNTWSCCSAGMPGSVVGHDDRGLRLGERRPRPRRPTRPGRGRPRCRPGWRRPAARWPRRPDTTADAGPRSDSVTCATSSDHPGLVDDAARRWPPGRRAAGRACGPGPGRRPAGRRSWPAAGPRRPSTAPTLAGRPRGSGRGGRAAPRR